MIQKSINHWKPVWVRLIGFSFLLAMIWGCGGDSSNSFRYACWTFSGLVVDGNTNQALSDVKITYLNIDGKTVVTSTDSNGSFFIENLPYGHKTFLFEYRESLDSQIVEYTPRIIQAGSIVESNAMEGILATGSKLIKLYPLSADVRFQIQFQQAETGLLLPASGAKVYIQYQDTTFVQNQASAWTGKADSLGNLVFYHLPADSNLSVVVDRFEIGNLVFKAQTWTLPPLQAGELADAGTVVLEQDSTGKAENLILASNVVDPQGTGALGISGQTVPWFKLNRIPDSTHMLVEVLENDSAMDVNPRLVKDTLYLEHAEEFSADSWIEIHFTSVDTQGLRMDFELTGNSRFKIRSGLRVVASNTWRHSDAYLGTFSLTDTLWVRFSEQLDTNVAKFQWQASSAEASVYGGGTSGNAKIWVRGDTLFVLPDQRLSLVDVSTVGLRVSVVSKSGNLSDFVEVSVPAEESPYVVKWTNTLNLRGERREDLRTNDSILIVASTPFDSLIGVSVYGDGTLPPGVQISDFVIRGDTIVYKPRLPMSPDVLYGMDFTIRNAAGQWVSDVMGVQWKTSYQVRILSVNNREGAGYRRFTSMGDSLQVLFSQPIDTSEIPFVVHMVDVLGAGIQTHVQWNKDFNQATIFNLSPLPTADFGDYSTLSSQAQYALAVRSVSFDFETEDGEIVMGLIPSTDSIKIYTEEGLVPVACNLLSDHAYGYEILPSETPVTDFPTNGVVLISFNRPLDTTYMIHHDPTSFIGLQTGGGVKVTASVDFIAEGNTIQITPDSLLTDGGLYYLWLKGIPAQGIRQADAINEHGGTYSGSNLGYQLLGTAFEARVP